MNKYTLNKNEPIFGNYKSQILNNDLKKYIIDYLYNKLELYNYRFIILENEETLNKLSENEHYVSPNYKGYNYLLLFLKINNKKYNIIINKKKLSYQKNKLEINNLNIASLYIDCPDEFYNGTILDGKLISPYSNNNNYIFLITDYYYLMDDTIDKYIKMDIIDKLNHINNIIKNIKTKHFDILINKLYTYYNIEHLIKNELPNIKIPILGIIFYPKKSGIQILFNENNKETIIINNNETIDNNSINIIQDFLNIIKNRNYVYENSKEYKNLWLIKTNTTDVYYVHDNLNNDKIGIALIPNIKTSHMCFDLINDKPVKFKCIYNNEFNKWQPIEPI
jgi:hypothetical protein